jgi:hypothetical protein
LQAIYGISIEHRKGRGYWRKVKNQKIFLDNLASKLNIQHPEDWYRVTTKMVLAEGGTFIRDHYNGSLIKGKQILYTKWQGEEIVLEILP